MLLCIYSILGAWISTQHRKRPQVTDFDLNHQHVHRVNRPAACLNRKVETVTAASEYFVVQALQLPHDHVTA